MQRICGVVLRAKTKTAASPIETTIFPTVLQFTVTFWSFAWKWINFYDVQFSANYSFGKVGKYFQILFRDGIYHWPEFIFLVLIKILISHLGTQDLIILLLRHASLLDYFYFFGNFAIVFIWLLSWHKQSLVALKLLNGSWIQPWWCARNEVMLIYLSVTSLILEGSSAHYFLLYAWFYFAITQSFRLFCRRLNANLTEDGPRGNVWHTWWTFWWGRLSNVNGMSQEEYFINRWQLCDCDIFICWFRWHTHLKDMNSLWRSICYGRYKQL